MRMITITPTDGLRNCRVLQFDGSEAVSSFFLLYWCWRLMNLLMREVY